jgi:ABC-type lipoprotein export system ATPase subunit
MRDSAIHRTSQAQNAYHIACEDLFKIYKSDELEVVALRGLDLKVGYGEFMAIVGASGSGKSTLLNILAGLDQLRVGRAFVGKRDLLTLEEAEMVSYRRNDVGFIWQQTGRNLVPYLSAIQNIEVPLLLNGISAKTARQRASELISAVNLENRAEHHAEQLSGGEQQRVSIAVALANNPPLLLADEPTGELDAIAADSIYALLGDLNSRFKTTIIIVTHDPEIASRVDRVIAIRDGRTSMEIFRSTERIGGVTNVVHDEYVLVDSAGRLQIPRELLDKLSIQERAKLVAGEKQILILPDNEIQLRERE